MKSMKGVKWCVGLIVAVAAGAGCLPAAGDSTGTEPVRVGSDLQLFVDDALIESMDGVALQLHRPVRREVVFRFDAPWEGPQSGYVTVLKDGDRFRMYYRGGGDTGREVTCLAEGEDGVHWERPSLGLFEFDGSTDNNIVHVGRHDAYSTAHNLAPFIDTNPSARPEQRYKAVALCRWHDPAINDRRIALAALVSSDGIHWERLREEPIITRGSFDSQNTAFWDAAQGRYVCYLRGGHQGKRAIALSTSADFVQWGEPEWLDYGGAPLEQFYTNAIIPYPRAPHLYFGFPMRFVPERTTAGMEERSVDALSDAVFMSSRDGLHWRRTFMEAFIRPGADPANWGGGHGNNTPAWGLLETAEGEISIYWCEGYGGAADGVYGSIPRVRRGVLRTDGFVSVHAGYDEGEFTTKPSCVRVGNSSSTTLPPRWEAYGSRSRTRKDGRPPDVNSKSARRSTATSWRGGCRGERAATSLVRSAALSGCGS